ncbi:MAG: hypothetical protein ACRDH2_16065, partial [Anaerolineales bacterium]
DRSIIVRDYAVQAVGNYAGTGKAAAEKAYPVLKEALTLWEGKQAGHALRGLANVASAAPRLGGELRAIGHAHAHFAGAGRGVVRKAAKQLMKATEARE